jgi:hypothetical protein
MYLRLFLFTMESIGHVDGVYALSVKSYSYRSGYGSPSPLHRVCDCSHCLQSAVDKLLPSLLKESCSKGATDP